MKGRKQISYVDFNVIGVLKSFNVNLTKTSFKRIFRDEKNWPTIRRLEEKIYGRKAYPDNSVVSIAIRKGF